jgi:hypothetical protein
MRDVQASSSPRWHLPAVDPNPEVHMADFTTRRALAALLVLLALVPRGAVAQDTPRTAAGPVGGTPEGWLWRTDSPARPQAGQAAQSGESFRFEPMAPVWHVTMGPGAILYGERERAAGRFSVAATLILFPEPTDAEYGVFVGGEDLSGANARWTAFVVRGDGSAAVIRSERGRSALVMPWTRFDAVVSRGSNKMAQNLVAVRAEPDSVRFVVNDIVVQTFARSSLALDGQFGLRIGEGVNMHVTNLDVTRRLAPSRSR